MGISAFFQSVGSGIVEAQQELDRRSRDYLLSRPPTAHPGVFRIPKVGAKFQFAADRVTKDGIDVIIYSSSDEKTIRQQHSVEFDIVSAPPPPDAVAHLAAVDAFSSLAPTVAGRSWVRDQLAKWGDEFANAAEKRKVAKFVGAFDSVLVLRGAAWWMLILPPPIPDDAPFSLDVAYVSTQDDPPQVRVFPAEPPQPAPEHLRTLLEELAALSAEQARVLGSAKGP
jgi:hypothetical protein